jgi:glyoxalase-like protein
MRAAVFVVTLAIAAGAVHAADGDGVLRRLDHLVYAVPDLDGGVADLERRLGVRAAPGGPHPGRGTRNALIALGPDSYLEILAPDPAQPRPAAGRWFGVDENVPPRLAGWAAKGADLERVAKSAAARGVPLGPVVAGSRQRPDGVNLKWTLTDPGVTSGVTLLPFFIDWAASPHPAATAARGPVLVSLRAEHPRPDLAREPLAALGLNLAVDAGPRPALVAVLRTVSGLVELR